MESLDVSTPDNKRRRIDAGNLPISKPVGCDFIEDETGQIYSAKKGKVLQVIGHGTSPVPPSPAKPFETRSDDLCHEARLRDLDEKGYIVIENLLTNMQAAACLKYVKTASDDSFTAIFNKDITDKPPKRPEREQSFDISSQ